MVDYKKFKIERLDPISPTFCASKWLQPNFYLYAGTTSSCQLPEPDKINLELVKQDIKYIDSTVEKVEQRKLMLEGKRPGKCANCWHIEDANNPTAIPERILYSHRFSNFDFSTFIPDDAPSPRSIAVAFDTLCNFSCSYCDASQSSSWYSDLKKNGAYKNIKGDPRFTYQKLGKNQSLNESDYDFLSDKFFEYVEQKLPGLEAITCLGGEPLISPNFWKFINRLSNTDTKHITLNITTNLSSKENVEKLLVLRENFKEIIISASIENIGTRAEFLRNGLNWQEFETTFKFLLEHKIQIVLLATLPGIALDGLVDFLEWYRPYSKDVNLEIHRLRHPNFQAPQVLPTNLKLVYAEEIHKWILKNESVLTPQLVEQIKNIVTILKNECIIFTDVGVDILQESAKAFYKEYARRNSYDIQKIFRNQLAEWILN